MNRRMRVFCFAFFCMLASRPGTNAEIAIPARFSKELATKVDAVAKAEVERQELVGLAVGLLRDGKIAFVGGYGWEDREAKIPVTRETRFRWASISKPITAVATMRLAEQGKLDLNADVRELVPEFPDPGAVITARDLLCHQGGIVHYANGKVVRTKQNYDAPRPFQNVILALDTFKESPLVNPPGEKYSYSTHGYILLSAAVERAANQPFAEYVESTIVRPLGMRTLQPDYHWEEIPHRAVGYRKIGELIVRSTDTDVSWKLGGGGFISSIDDMIQFGAGLVNRQLLKQKTYDQMWTQQKQSDGKPTGYGLGFGVSGTGLNQRVTHSGAQEKSRTFLIMIPGRRVAVAVMTNSEYAKPAPIAEMLLPLVLPKGENRKRDK